MVMPEEPGRACISARRRAHTASASRSLTLKLTYIGSSVDTVARSVASPFPTKAPTRTSARPMRPSSGDLTDV